MLCDCNEERAERCEKLFEGVADTLEERAAAPLGGASCCSHLHTIGRLWAMESPETPDAPLTSMQKPEDVRRDLQKYSIADNGRLTRTTMKSIVGSGQRRDILCSLVGVCFEAMAVAAEHDESLEKRLMMVETPAIIVS